VQLRDKEKKLACQLLGITLIEVPYWWDASKGQIEAMVHAVRPDIVLQSSYKIPSLLSEKQTQARLAPLEDYLLIKSKGYPKCRGCNKVIEPDTIRIAARATNVRVKSPFKVQVCYLNYTINCDRYA
jgi:hypothetical protein